MNYKNESSLNSGTKKIKYPYHILFSLSSVEVAKPRARYASICKATNYAFMKPS